MSTNESCHGNRVGGGETRNWLRTRHPAWAWKYFRDPAGWMGTGYYCAKCLTAPLTFCKYRFISKSEVYILCAIIQEQPRNIEVPKSCSFAHISQQDKEEMKCVCYQHHSDTQVSVSLGNSICSRCTVQYNPVQHQVCSAWHWNRPSIWKGKRRKNSSPLLIIIITANIISGVLQSGLSPPASSLWTAPFTALVNACVVKVEG